MLREGLCGDGENNGGCRLLYYCTISLNKKETDSSHSQINYQGGNVRPSPRPVAAQLTGISCALLEPNTPVHILTRMDTCILYLSPVSPPFTGYLLITLRTIPYSYL